MFKPNITPGPFYSKKRWNDDGAFVKILGKDGAWVADTHSQHADLILKLHEYQAVYEAAKAFVELHKDDLIINYQSTFNALAETLEELEER